MMLLIPEIVLINKRIHLKLKHDFCLFLKQKNSNKLSILSYPSFGKLNFSYNKNDKEATLLDSEISMHS